MIHRLDKDDIKDLANGPCTVVESIYVAATSAKRKDIAVSVTWQKSSRTFKNLYHSKIYEAQRFPNVPVDRNASTEPPNGTASFPVSDSGCAALTSPQAPLMHFPPTRAQSLPDGDLIS
jgi:hypothetical protein